MTIQRSRISRNRRRGATIVVVALVTPLLLGFAALSIDVGMMYSMDAETQSAVDAAALAGASALTYNDPSIARQRARDTLAPNLVSATNGENTSVVDIGSWNEISRAFTLNGSPTNAVRVTATRRNAPLFFGAVLGWRQYDMTRSAVAVLVPRDIAVAIDLSGSMNDDSELRHYRSYISEDGVSTRPAVQINLKDIWISLPSSKSYNGIGNGNNPASPGAATANNNQPATGSGRPQRVVGNPDSGNEPAGGSANPGGPRWGWMTGWGSALTVGSYTPTTDGGLYYIPKSSTCSDADVIANLTEAGYSANERTALLSGTDDSSSSRFHNRVKALLGLAGWKSGKSGGKYTGSGLGDGDDRADDSEMTGAVAWPFNGGSWDEYIDYVSSSSSRMYATDSNLRHRYGLKTVVNYLLEKQSGHASAPELAATPELPLNSVKNAVQIMADLLQNLGGNDQLSLEVFATTSHHEVNLSTNYQAAANRMNAMQSNYYDNSTNIGAGLNAAVSELLSARGRTYARRIIILMTDGKPNCDQTNSSSSTTSAVNWATNRAQYAANNNITIYTIAVGGDADRSVTQSIASIGGGQEFFAGGTPDQYTPQLQQIFQQLGGMQIVQLVK